jgi:hypothetical protein
VIAPSLLGGRARARRANISASHSLDFLLGREGVFSEEVAWLVLGQGPPGARWSVSGATGMSLHTA